jgi:fluoroacetyl-CoA thioesterase
MITVMENAALNAIKTYLEPGETALGTRVDVRHFSPSPLGMRVVGEARVVHVDGRRVEFRITAIDETGQIGSGTHETMIIEVARVEKRLDDKRAALAHLQSLAGKS